MEVETEKRQLHVAKHRAVPFVRLHILHGGHGVENDINVLTVTKSVNGSVRHVEGAVVVVVWIGVWINVPELPTLARLKPVQGDTWGIFGPTRWSDVRRGRGGFGIDVGISVVAIQRC